MQEVTQSVERVVVHLQQVANDPALAQFQQWLRIYMLYAGVAITPIVEVVNPEVPRLFGPVSTLQQIRWKGARLQLSQRLLQEIPPRLLALLAVRNYIEADTFRRSVLRSILYTIVLFPLLSVLVYILGERFPQKAYEWAMQLVVLLPIRWVWSWWSHLAEQVERKLLQHTGEEETLLQALEAVARLDLKRGVPDKQVDELLNRLNALRRERGYPDLSREALLPPRPPEEEASDTARPPAMEKGEFLRRHPPDEYNKVDRVRV